MDEAPSATRPTRIAGWRTIIATALIVVVATVATLCAWVLDDRGVHAAAERSLARLAGLPASPPIAEDAMRAAAAAAVFTRVAKMARWDESRHQVWSSQADAAAWIEARRLLDDAEVAGLLDALESLPTDAIASSLPSLGRDRDNAMALLQVCARGGDERESARVQRIALRLPTVAWPHQLLSSATRQRLQCLEAIARRPPKDPAIGRALAADLDVAADDVFATLRGDAAPFVSSIATQALRADPLWMIGMHLGVRLTMAEEWRVVRAYEAKRYLARDLDDLAEAAVATATAPDAQSVLRGVRDIDPRVLDGVWGLHANLHLVRENVFRAAARRILLARAVACWLRREPMPTDPFAPAPLRVLADDEGLVAIWSVGSDRHDDGGRAGDLILLPRPRSRAAKPK